MTVSAPTRSLRLLTLLATIGVLSAFAPLPPPQSCNVRLSHAPLFAANDESAAASLADDVDEFQEEREEKNRLRLKFGAPRMSKDEYIVYRAELREMEEVQGELQRKGKIEAIKKRKEDRAQQDRERERRESANKPGFFQSLRDKAGF